MSKSHNIVFIMTDTQNRDMVGCYGNKNVDTPNLDRLAEEGIRFDRAYTTSPVCTPARGAIFSGMHPQINGAYCNNVAPHRHIPLMGEIFRNQGYRAAYTGKWHLDGAGYFGDGVPGGGFEPDWWYDGKCYADDIGEEMFQRYRSHKSADLLREWGFTEENIWGHRVASRAIDFLEKVGSEPFVLAVSFDEPHGPFVTPAEYWEGYRPEQFTVRPNFGAPLDGKPELQRWQTEGRDHKLQLEDGVDFASTQNAFRGCNSYIDREIGRVIDAVDRLHGRDTLIIYTSDHGDMQGSHGLFGKGPMMYEEITNIPFIVRAPDGARGAVSSSLVSHVDILPTLLDYAGLCCPPSMQGTSLRPLLKDPGAKLHDHALISWSRFAINHDSFGEFYPIRCLTDGRYKLAINLLDTDELYDLEEDPYEMSNRIDDPALSEIRDALHDALLDEMDRIRDTFRSTHWAHRPWRAEPRVQPPYTGVPGRGTPKGFAFQSESVG
ncbi:MAG: sulfatase-like hydrolase/transferase [Planctomycetes bacterium]|nr:sulfatase-like hydrolase/transferase [Planctomycetota bacterium]